MIYELAVVTTPELNDDAVTALKEMVNSVVTEYKGEVAVSDDWGTLRFAQPTNKGLDRGHFVYFIYKTDAQTNQELERRLRIHENVVKFIFVRKGDDSRLESVVKTYKSPYSKKYRGSQTDDLEDNTDMAKARRKFARRKSCWYTAKKIDADWKDPATFAWLINEFGKIVPARVSGVSTKHQRFVTTAIKRARQMGIASYLTNHVAE